MTNALNTVTIDKLHSLATSSESRDLTTSRLTYAILRPAFVTKASRIDNKIK